MDISVSDSCHFRMGRLVAIASGLWGMSEAIKEKDMQKPIKSL